MLWRKLSAHVPLKQHVCLVQTYMDFAMNNTYPVLPHAWKVALELSHHLLELAKTLHCSEMAKHSAFLEFTKMLEEASLDAL